MLEPWGSRWFRADAAVLLLITLWAVAFTQSRWSWFFALLILPDMLVGLRRTSS